ncbi:hypothetical protein Tco_0825624 [Tanacetum coccineum]
MRMRQYICHTDHNLWDVIVNGDLEKELAPTEDQSGPYAPPALRLQTNWLLAQESGKKFKSILLIGNTLFGGSKKLIKSMDVTCAPISKEDINQKFLRSLPSSWNQISLIMRNKPDIDEIDIDDLYNIFGSTNEVSTATRDFRVSTTGGINQISSTLCAHDVAYSFFAQPTTSPQLENEDFQQMDGDDLEELDLRWQVAMLTIRVKKSGRNQGRRSYGDNGKSNAPTTESSSHALVAQDGLGGYDWSNDFEVEPVNYALMAISSSSSSSSSDSESLESRILGHEKNELAWGEKYEFQNYELKCREIKINNLNLELEKVVKERDELKDKIAKWEESTKNLDEILNGQMSARDKTGLGYGTQLNELSSNHETDSENCLDEYAIRNKIIESQTTELNTKTSETAGVLQEQVCHRPVLVAARPVCIVRPSVSTARLVCTARPLLVPSGLYFVGQVLVLLGLFVLLGQVFVLLGQSISTARPICIARPSVSTASLVCTARPSLSTARPVYATRPIYLRMDYGGNIVNTGKGKLDTDLKKSRWVWRPKGNYLDHVSKDSGSFMLKKVEAIQISCYRIIQWWIVVALAIFLATKLIFQTMKISIEALWLLEVIPKEKNSVLFTESECLILSPSFKLLDESQVVLRAPRKDDVYSLDLKNIVPSGGKSPIISFMRPFGCPLTILNTLDSLGKFDGKSDEDQPNVTGTGPNWMFDLDFLPIIGIIFLVSIENQEKYSDTYCFHIHHHRTRILIEDVAPAAHEKPSESSPKDNYIQDSGDVIDKMVTQELDAKAMDDVSRQAFEEEMEEKLHLKEGSSSYKSNTPYVSAARTSTGANAGESSFGYLGGKIPIDASTLPNADLPIDPNMPDLEDASDTIPNDRIFNGAYDDDEDVGSSRGQNSGDPTSAIQTRGKIQKASLAQQALLLSNFVEKFLGTMKFGNDQIPPVLGYGDVDQGNITIKRVYYIKGLNHNLFSVGKFCDADLEVSFQKSTCYVHDLKGNDFLTELTTAGYRVTTAGSRLLLLDSKIIVPSTIEEKTCKKNDVKARSLLLMALPNEHQLTFDQYVDAQSMFAVIKARFGGNETTKKTQNALLKQQYENFSASRSKSLDSIFNRLQRLVSRLAILGVVTPPKDLNVKFLRSLPSEWDTHMVVWMNNPDFETMGLDDLYNNFKIVEQKVKKSAGASNDDKNLAFVTTSGAISTNNINTVNPEVSIATTKVNTASTKISTASFSNATVYAFLSTQPKGSQLVHEDLEQLHDDDLEEIDLKWNMALLSMRARKFYQRTVLGINLHIT